MHMLKDNMFKAKHYQKIEVKPFIQDLRFPPVHENIFT